MSGATPEDSGIASGLVNTSMQVGGAVALSVLATFAAERTTSQIDGGASALEALNADFHVAFFIAAGIAAFAIVAAVLVLRDEREPEGDPAAVGLEIEDEAVIATPVHA